MIKYQLGLVSVSFREQDPLTIIRAVRDAGLSCIEWGSDVHAPCKNPDRLEEIAALQKEYGIGCCSYGTYFRFGCNMTEELGDYIQAAKILGTRILRLWCGKKGSQKYTEEEKQELFVMCRQAAEMAEKQDVVLCLECHHGTFTDTRESALELMEAVHSPNFRMYWQPNQYKTIEENMAYAKALADWTVHLHVFNWEGEEKYPLGDAVSLWKDYLNCFEGRRCLLLEFMPDGRIESLAAEAEALKKIAYGQEVLK